MRIYTDAVEMIKEVERDLFEMGIRYQSTTVQDRIVGNDPEFQTIELTAYQYSLKNPGLKALGGILDYMGIGRAWPYAELLERLKGAVNPGVAWEADPIRWERFLRDGKFSYFYPERLYHQIQAVIQELTEVPETRQAVMTMYDVHQDLMNWRGRDRVPCSMSYHFLLRGKELTCIYEQRSCDFIQFFAADVFVTCGMLLNVAGQVPGVESTRFVHSIHSLHAFQKDLDGRNIF